VEVHCAVAVPFEGDSFETETSGSALSVPRAPCASERAMSGIDPSTPLRVGFYVDSTEIGGAEVFLRYLLGALSREIEVAVIGVDQGVIEHVLTDCPSASARLVPRVSARNDLRSLARHVAAIHSLRPVVLHVNQRHLFAGQYGVIAGGLSRLPMAAVVHSRFPSDSRSQHHLTRLVSHAVATYVAVSHFVAEGVSSELGVEPSRLRVFRNAVPTLQGKASAAKPRPGLILGVGRLAREKGFDILISALTELPEARLTLVGEGSERGALEAQVDHLGLRDRVRFAGWSERSWAACFEPTVVAVPSRNEAASLVALEALAAGVPVVASRVGGIPEYVTDGECGLLVPPESPRELAKALRRVLYDEGLQTKLGQAGRERSETTYPFGNLVSAYAALYRELATARREPRLWSARTIVVDA